MKPGTRVRIRLAPTATPRAVPDPTAGFEATGIVLGRDAAAEDCIVVRLVAGALPTDALRGHPVELERQDG